MNWSTCEPALNASYVLSGRCVVFKSDNSFVFNSYLKVQFGEFLAFCVTVLSFCYVLMGNTNNVDTELSFCYVLMGNTNNVGTELCLS